MASPWVRPRAAGGAERVRLYCLPHAGGSAALFHGWARELPAWIDVAPVFLPGRERRLAEPPLDDAGRLAEALLAGLRPELDAPWAVFGTSMGAQLGFELVRRAEALADPRLAPPAALFAAACRAPHLPDRNPPLAGLSDDAFLRAVAAFGGTPPEVLEHGELLRLVLPALRADMALSEGYRFRGDPVACPVVPLGGAEDPLVSPEELGAWSAVTRAPRPLRLFDGGHFFQDAARADVLSAVTEELEAARSR